MIFLLGLFTGALSFAYIPEYAMIANRAADQHGKGAYQLEQEVTFHKEGEVYTVKETWLVLDENKLRVTLEGRGALKGLVQGTILYEGGQKFFAEAAQKSLRTQRLGDDWLEPLFFFRNGKYFRTRMVNLKVTPADALRDRAPLNSEGELGYEPSGFVRLSRVGGAIAWAIGAPPTTSPHPTVWIEQDQFVLRRFRGGDQVQVRANEYTKHEDGFWFPQQRIYNFGAKTVEIQTLQVKALGKLRSDDPRFRTSSLNVSHDALKLPDADALKEFYSRFR